MRDFEYGGVWVHATDKFSRIWRQKGALLVPPVEEFHRQFAIFKQLGLERYMSGGI